ncbi:MAG TPA: hypothetical protein VLH16_01580, partial [Bacteroidales bacterium]|nr:hypothetical protein [Bacteroidales bacterium]
AITLGYKQLQVALFVSHRNIDATINEKDTLTGKATVVSAIRTTGFHRTESEWNHRRSLGESLYGIRASFRGKNYQVGITGYGLDYSAEIQPADMIYNRYFFRGNRHAVAGADFFYLFRNLQLFGEAAITHTGAKALQLGALAHPSSRLALSVVYRDFSKEFPYMWNAPFSESASPSGEQGIYTGMTFFLSRNLTFSGYADYFRFRWLRFQADAPGHGFEYRGELGWQLSRSAEIRVRYRYKQREANLNNDQILALVLPGKRQSFRLHLQYQASPSLTLRNRAEVMQSSQNGTTSNMGFLIYQDLIWRPGNDKWYFAIRYAIFDTDTYNERIYAYENDVLYAFSVPAYYYQGSRSYLLIRRQMTNNLDFWFKIGQTWWANTNLVGSGLDEIEGNTRSEVRAQIRYKF